jgi:hypothetical protein
MSRDVRPLWASRRRFETAGSAAAGEINVDEPTELGAAIESARPGDVIRVADGEYRFDERLVAASSGTASSPITLRGSREAIIRTKNASGDYGLHITGDFWRIEGLTIAHATKGIVRGNVFRRAGISGKNSADSAVDAKGNNWLIEANVVLETDAPWDDDGTMRPSEFADGFQSHSVYDGYGTGNMFRANRVEGPIRGFGVGLYPALDNVVTCDNEAYDAAGGPVGDNGQPLACTP